MGLTDQETVVGYHDATKHHPGRYARSLGYLDWATQPDPFRRFAAAPLLTLPLPQDDRSPPYDDLYRPGAVAPAALSLDSLSQFFFLSLAISAWKQAGPSRWALRVNPSSGNLHPTEGYAVLPAIAGLSDAPGVYHYAPREHGLELRATLPSAEWISAFPDHSFLVGLSSIHWREAWKYGERAFRYCQHDAGHALAAMRLSAAAQGWTLAVLTNFGDEDVAAILGLDRAPDFAGAEREAPELLAVVSPARSSGESTLDLSADHIRGMADAESWHGSANVLSSDHVPWEIIDLVQKAVHKPRTPPAPRIARRAGAIDELPPRPVSAQAIIRQRRSALDFDGETSIPAEMFYHMLARTVPALQPLAPWDMTSWPIRIHLALFVHLVTGLPKGLYVLARDEEKKELLRAAMKPEFAWSRPPGCPEELPLYLLQEADCRQAAAQLSLGQAIAGMSAFSLGMLAEFESALREQGAWAYRSLFWEAGMVGQVLYLEAEAAGVRATGIGAYFDDLVHDVFGLSGHTVQSMYHFTVGGHVDDPRLTTLPSYPR